MAWQYEMANCNLPDKLASCLLEMDAMLAGRWTVDMFAMFHLGRPNVFPLGDLAVRKGLQELYKLKVHLFLLHLLQVQLGQEAANVRYFVSVTRNDNGCA